MRALIIAAILAAPAVAHADDAKSCLAELDARGVSYRKVQKKGVAIAVEIDGPLGGVAYKQQGGKAFLVDCSLAVSLDEAGRYLTDLGITEGVFSSTYARRNVRGTSRPSKHSYALAMDLNTLSGPTIGTLRVALDYEQGLGDAVDCIGQPLTQGGAILRTVHCQLVHSGLFRSVLSPDYDDAHHNHFHLEARRWADRPTLRSEAPAIH